LPSRPVPLNETVVVAPQLIALFGTVVAPLTLQEYATAVSVSDTANCGAVTLAGEVDGADNETVGVGGAVVSNVYVAAPAALVFPAGSVAVTDNV
jgi:hypothetical protein